MGYTNKFRLLPSGAIKTRYETKELKLSKRASETIKLNDGIMIMKGTFLLSIDDNAKATESDIRQFVNAHFEDTENAYKRINSIINPSRYNCIF